MGFNRIIETAIQYSPPLLHLLRLWTNYFPDKRIALNQILGNRPEYQASSVRWNHQ
jgi:hypothetical protein